MNDGTTTTVVQAPRLYAATMLRPGQPGAPFFDKVNVTDFLRHWNIETEDYGLDPRQKCERVWFYCSEDVKRTIEFFDGYRRKDWEALETELKTFFYRYDSSRTRHIHDLTALNQIIADARNMDLSNYILKFSAISSTLVTEGSLSNVERVSRLLDGLDDDLRKRILKRCAREDWKVSTRSRGTVEPNFEELKKLIVAEANTEELTLAYKEDSNSRKGGVAPGSLLAPTLTPVSTLTPPPASALAPASSVPLTPATTSTPSADTPKDPIAELTAKFEAMTLLTNRAIEKMVAAISGQQPQRGPGQGGSRQYPRVALCYFCDEEGHTRRDCPHYKAAEQQGLVRLGADGKVLDAVSGQAIPLAIRRGGMKVSLGRNATTPATGTNTIPLGQRPSMPSVNNVTLEPETAQLGEDETMCLMVKGTDGNWYQTYVDADVEVKRKINDGEASHVPDKRPRVQRPVNRPIPMEVDPPAQQPLPVIAPRPPAPIQPPVHPVEKFKLQSDVRKDLDPTTLGNRILDLPITLSVRETLAASPEIADYVMNVTKKKRQPVVSLTEIEGYGTEATVASTSATRVGDRSLYSAPSGTARATLNGELEVRGLLDHVSEVNLISLETFEKLDLPIDSNINWTIGMVDKRATNPLVGVCHDVPVTIGGVTTLNQIFVAENLKHELLLGRPWERIAQARLENRGDGSCWVTIKSPDGLRAATFRAAEGTSGRERAHVREPLNV